jgi:hypothetical protein
LLVRVKLLLRLVLLLLVRIKLLLRLVLLWHLTGIGVVALPI